MLAGGAGGRARTAQPECHTLLLLLLLLLIACSQSRRWRDWIGCVRVGAGVETGCVERGREGGTMVAAGGVVRCRWTAVPVVLMLFAACAAVVSGSEGNNETRATWEVQFTSPTAYMHQLAAPLLPCVGRRLRPDQSLRCVCAVGGHRGQAVG